MSSLQYVFLQAGPGVRLSVASYTTESIPDFMCRTMQIHQSAWCGFIDVVCKATPGVEASPLFLR